eukprot:TRINITY_DN1436_c0_g1_i2.p1 TRINITY_DN1436_c0_g1~~TRINITY_DN1436_c0_g1_i2.p1  ORF type:complete len:263 (+),score=41.45 TRINITY_DN1436_c0_g1_i2:294-1082(+)
MIISILSDLVCRLLLEKKKLYMTITRWTHYDTIMVNAILNMYFKNISAIIVYPLLIIAILRVYPFIVVLSVMMVLYHLYVVLPDYLTPPKVYQSEDGDVMTVYSANLLMVNSDPSVTTEEIVLVDADVVMVTEYSTQWHASFVANGVFDMYPYREYLVRNDSFGSAILSKYPFSDSSIWEIDDYCPISRARIAFVGREISLYNIHTYPPRTREYTVSWNKQNETLLNQFISEKDAGNYVICAGDFNASQYNKIVQDIEQSGF